MDGYDVATVNLETAKRIAMQNCIEGWTGGSHAGLVLFFGLRGVQSLTRILQVIYMRRPYPSTAQV